MINKLAYAVICILTYQMAPISESSMYILGKGTLWYEANQCMA